VRATDIDIQRIITPEFLHLDRILSRFNVFRATDMARREVKHTKCLANLLNPREPHGLGVRFLESIIFNLGAASPSSSLDLLNLDLLHAEILSEKGLVDQETGEKAEKKIDLLILLPSLSPEKKDVILAIELKIDSKESRDQLSTYRALIEKNIQGTSSYCIFL